jgi:hypothetical protein
LAVVSCIDGIEREREGERECVCVCERERWECGTLNATKHLKLGGNKYIKKNILKMLNYKTRAGYLTEFSD